MVEDARQHNVARLGGFRCQVWRQSDQWLSQYWRGCNVAKASGSSFADIKTVCFRPRRCGGGFHGLASAPEGRVSTPITWIGTQQTMRPGLECRKPQP